MIKEYVTCFERGKSWATVTCYFLVSQGSHTSRSCVDYTGKGDNQAPGIVLKRKCATTNDFFPSVTLLFYFQQVAASVNTSTYLPPETIYTFFSTSETDFVLGDLAVVLLAILKITSPMYLVSLSNEDIICLTGHDEEISTVDPLATAGQQYFKKGFKKKKKKTQKEEKRKRKALNTSKKVSV